MSTRSGAQITREGASRDLALAKTDPAIEAMARVWCADFLNLDADEIMRTTKLPRWVGYVSNAVRLLAAADEARAAKWRRAK